MNKILFLTYNFRPPLPSLVVALETLATRRAVHFVQELDLQGSIFEDDSELSILAIKNQYIHHPSCGHLIKDIICLQLFPFRTILSFIYVGEAML